MTSFLKIIKIIFLFSILTILTQVGGVVYLLYLPFSSYVKSEKMSGWKNFVSRLLGFSMIYFLIWFFIIPPLAKKYGRVPLPIYATKESPVKAGSLIYAIGNRNYVKPALRDAFFEVAKKVNKKYTDVELIYLDANFPFYEGFPLLPHLSHDDGEKLDIAFLYRNKKSKIFYNKTFSIIGYGVTEDPKKGESNKPAECEKAGKWQYSFLKKMTFAKVKKGYEFDEAANRFLLLKIMEEQKVKKIFIEPHLKERMRLSKYKKIRFHGCHAVRHDDHIHFQINN